MSLNITSSLFVVCMLAWSTFGADRLRIKVLITAEDELSSQTSSYVKRNLRALGDVDIVEESPDYTLAFVFMELTTGGKTKTGYAESLTILSPFPKYLTDYYFIKKA